MMKSQVQVQAANGSPRPKAQATDARTLPPLHRGAEAALQVAQRAARWMALTGGCLVLAAGGLVCAEIVARKFFGGSTGVADELCSYGLAIGSTLAFPQCLIDRAHIRVDSATRFLPPGPRILVDLLALVSMIAFFGMVAWYAADTALVSWQRDARAVTTLQTPLALPQGLWAAAYLLFLAITAVLLIAAVSRLLRRDIAGARRLIATNSRTEDAEAHL